VVGEAFGRAQARLSHPDPVGNVAEADAAEYGLMPYS